MKGSRLPWRWVQAMAIASIAAAPLGAMAQATPIYRCGNAYSQWPCSSAPALVVDEAPSPAERAGSMRVAAAQARWADRLRAERLAAEAHTRPALAVSIGPVPATTAAAPVSSHPAAHRKRRSLQPDTGDDFIAHVPAAPKQHQSTAK